MNQLTTRDSQLEVVRLKAENDRLVTAFEYHKTESARKGRMVAQLEAEMESLKQRFEKSAPEFPLGKKAINTLLKMVGGMAMAIYGFDPGGKRSDVVSAIQNDLDLKGVNLDADTIRKWLRESAKVLKSAENNKAKPK